MSGNVRVILTSAGRSFFSNKSSSLQGKFRGHGAHRASFSLSPFSPEILADIQWVDGDVSSPVWYVVLFVGANLVV